MTEPTVQLTKPPRTWRPMILWSAGILLALGLVWFATAVAIPVWRVRSAVAACAEDKLQPAEAIAKLGGPERAATLLLRYLELNERMAPEKALAASLLAACGKDALPVFLRGIEPGSGLSSRGRVACLGAIARIDPSLGPKVFAAALEQERDAGVAAIELILVGLYRDAASAELVASFLDDPRPEVRAAAADALGVIHAPAYRIPLSELWCKGDLPGIPSDPPLTVKGLVALNAAGGGLNLSGGLFSMHLADGVIDLPSNMRARLEKVMLAGATAAEREAAARALLCWPPAEYRLRVAEWGVWLAQGSELKLIREQIEEIPPFVHQTGECLRDLSSRYREGLPVFKPVIHVSAERAMVVDLEVQLRNGRPYFAFPLPDDLSLGLVERSWLPPSAGAQPQDVSLAPLDNGALARLSSPSEGYPWLEPHHRTYGWAWRDTGVISSLGVRWQSLIVSPKRLPWMAPPPVPADPKFGWWERLRKVNASWLASRGEAERFLYYDGPTRASAPVEVMWKAGELAFKSHRPKPRKDQVKPDEAEKFGVILSAAQTGRKDYDLRRGLFIEVAGGAARGQAVEIPKEDGNLRLAADGALDAAGLRKTLAGYLAEAGLAAEEADGLIDCWTPQFFKSEGRRFVTVLSARDYDELCPIRIRPAPTELVRVGLLLAEFAAEKK